MMFRDFSGKISMFRVSHFLGVLAGIALCVCAVIGWFCGLPDPWQMAIIGAGIFGPSQFAKAIQRKYEPEAKVE